MKEKLVPSSWLEKEGRRLDCGPYLSGAIEAKLLLEKLPVSKEKLHTLTAGFDGGIFNGPQFVRNYVTDASYGVPFLTGSSMLLADLSRADLLKKRDACSPRLRHLQLSPGMTLISCSGTIGNMVYARPDMAEVWSSQDILKVAPDADKIPPGYLFAYLASKYGIPLVVGGTYGAIIQHIEPEHVRDLPVPRLNDGTEEFAHKRIDTAARLRAESQQLRTLAKSLIEQELGWTNKSLAFHAGVVKADQLQRRLDGFYHSDSVRSARSVLAEYKETSTVRNVVESIIEPNRGPRRKVEDPAFGVPFLSSSEVFSVSPSADYLISKRTADLDSFIISERDVLIPRSGQVGGLIGRAVLPVSSIVGMAGTEHLVRLRCHTQDDAALLWAILASQPGYFAVVGTAFGSSIPSIDRTLVGDLTIPWPKDSVRDQLIETVMRSRELSDNAIAQEKAAISAVESAIEGLVS